MNPGSLRLVDQAFPLILCLALAAGVCSVAGAETTQADQAKRSLRLAIPQFVADAGSESLKPKGQMLIDLLTSHLSIEQGFELVERAALDKVLRETTLSVSGATKPEQAVRVGKLLRADWFLLGSFLKIGGTNFLLAKIVDAQTGVLRDLTSLPFLETNLTQTAEALAAFAVSSRQSVRTLSERVFLAMGAFEDLGLHSRYPDFGEHLRAAMAAHYRGSRIAIVERSQVNPLLNELRLSLGGLTDPSARSAAVQPAFLLVDGLYQSFQDEQSKINMVLRLEPIGGRMRTVTLKEMAGKPLENKVAEAIERVLQEPKTPVLTPTRRDEFKAQLKRGKELARFGLKARIGPVTALPPFDSYRATRVPVINDATHAFEAALLLDPDSVEAKFYLAVCLADPQIEKREEARDYWREVIASSTNSDLVLLSRKGMADSYLEKDDSQALELFSVLKRETRDIEEIANYNHTLADVYVRSFRAKKISREALLEFLTESWRTDCQKFQARGAGEGTIDAYGGFERRPSDYYPAFEKDNSGLSQHAAGVVSNLANEFPRLTPYLVSGYLRWFGEQPLAGSPQGFRQFMPEVWKKWYGEILLKCERGPEGMLSPKSFYSGSLWRDLNLFLRREDFETAERVANLIQGQGRKYLIRPSQDELDLDLGYLSFRREKWKEALAAFERIGDREVPTTTHLKGPWGTGTFASAKIAAQACRERLGNTNSVSKIAIIPSPRFVKAWPGKEIIFKVDGSRIWGVDETGLYEYNPGLGEFRRHNVSVPPNTGDWVGSAFGSLALARGKIWIGTHQNGIMAVDPATDSTTNYTVNDGLLTPYVAALFPFEDRLWIGFDGSKGGGIGYLDLKENRFVGMMAELPSDLAQAPARGAYSGSLGRGASAPRAGIRDFTRAGDGQLWAMAMGAALRYIAKENRWQTFSMECTSQFSAMAASERFLVFPCYQPSGWSSDRTQFGGLLIYDLAKHQCRRLAAADGLPNVEMRSVAIVSDKAWIGGKSFVARVDLPSARLEKLCKLRTVFRVRCLEVVGNDIWFSAGPGLYRLSHDAN